MDNDSHARNFGPFGYSFEVRSSLTPDEAKAELRKQKQGWFDPKTGPRGWILGSVLCLQLSAIAQNGPVVLALISDDGFGSRIHGRVGPDLAMPVLIAAALALPAYAAIFRTEDRPAMLMFAAAFFLFVGGVLWMRSRFREDAEPLVRFIRRVLETPTARSVQTVEMELDHTPIQSATLIVDGDDIGIPPSEHDVAQAILAMEPDGFLIIDFGSNTFMQTVLEYDRFILEKCEGSDNQLYRANGDFQSNDIIAVMTAYLRGAQPSKRIVWDKVSG
jgi:hypothetical protein